MPIDEFFDEPRTRHTVDSGMLSGDPLHRTLLKREPDRRSMPDAVQRFPEGSKLLRVHALLFEIEVALETAEHVVVDRAFGAKTQQRLSFGADHVPSDLAMLDQLAVAFGAGAIPRLPLDVLGPVRVRGAELIEQRTMSGPHRVQLVDAAAPRLHPPPFCARLFFAPRLLGV